MAFLRLLMVVTAARPCVLEAFLAGERGLP
jgi:hypothetical protein